MRIHLLEGFRGVQQNAIKKLLKEDYSHAFEKAKNGNRIFKGFDMPLNKDVLLLTPIKNRKSANTHNYYTLWINNNAEWYAYPKRNLICSSNYNTADRYAFDTAFIVLPKNGANIGICPTADIWFSTINNFGMTLSSFNEFLKGVFDILKTHLKLIQNPQSYKQLYNNILSINKAIGYKKNLNEKLLKETIKELRIFTTDYDTINNIIMENGFLIFVERFLSPTLNGFEHTTIENYKIPSNTSHEIWLDSDCLIFEYQYFKNNFL